VARLQSFARAAEELCVTHGAVSHRIKLLEQHFGTRLFVRSGRSVTLTSKGTYLLGTVVEVLFKLHDAGQRLTQWRPVVTVSAGPSAAHYWLKQRLACFYRAHPEIDLDLRATQLSRQRKRASVETGEVDIAIRYGSAAEWTGLTCVKLMDVELFPVCSPAYAQMLGGVRRIEDLRKAVLLRLPHEPWRPWFRAAGVGDWPEPTHGPIFGDASLLLGAALGGQGVALARNVLVDEDLAGGRLVRLFDIAVSSPSAYHAVCAPGTAARGEVASFIEWLVASSQPVSRQTMKAPRSRAAVKHG
jgi:LysR family transcriptional regulator, glycine cleavage system transcriptional activator